MNNKPLITPGHLIGNRQSGRYDYGIICFRGFGGSEMVVNALGAKRLKTRIFYCLKPENLLPSAYETEIGGKRIALITGAVFGGPQAAIYTEEMRYIGIRRIIGLSIAAKLSARTELGDHFYVDRVLCADGVSSSYYDSKRVIERSYLKDELISLGKNMGLQLKTVTGASVDTIYNETPQIIGRLRELNVDVVNLEIGAFAATCKLRGVESALIGYVSDSLTDQGWRDWYWDRTEANRISVDLLKLLIKSLSE